MTDTAPAQPGAPALPMNTPAYIGRFAPTPSGYLHFGSLIAALASYLDARAANGKWLVRMEDLDPPREQPGAADAILRTLESYGLEWDGPVLYQSQRHEAYQAIIDQWLRHGLAYACACSRKALEPYQGVYPGLCRNAGHPWHDAAIRIRVPELRYGFDDRVQGHFEQHLGEQAGDFVILRRDGLYAYQLAVVLDDGLQGVTDIVRGADLLDSTPRQLYLQELLGLPAPRYLHLPLITQPDGHKLGKRYRSPPLEADQAPALLIRALRALGQPLPDATGRLAVSEILPWAIEHWTPTAIPGLATLPEASL